MAAVMADLKHYNRNQTKARPPGKRQNACLFTAMYVPPEETAVITILALSPAFLRTKSSSPLSIFSGVFCSVLETCHLTSTILSSVFLLHSSHFSRFLSLVWYWFQLIFSHHSNLGNFEYSDSRHTLHYVTQWMGFSFQTHLNPVSYIIKWFITKPWLTFHYHSPFQSM